MESLSRVIFAWMIVCAALVCCSQCKSAEPILYFSADNGLAVPQAKGNLVPGKTGAAVYLSGNTRIPIPIDKFNLQEGTLSFWFRPDMCSASITAA